MRYQFRFFINWIMTVFFILSLLSPAALAARTKIPRHALTAEYQYSPSENPHQEIAPRKELTVKLKHERKGPAQGRRSKKRREQPIAENQSFPMEDQDYEAARILTELKKQPPKASIKIKFNTFAKNIQQNEEPRSRLIAPIKIKFKDISKKREPQSELLTVEEKHTFNVAKTSLECRSKLLKEKLSKKDEDLLANINKALVAKKEEDLDFILEDLRKAADDYLLNACEI